MVGCMTTSSAPGKVILLGEHAVVYGQPALAVPVTQVQATATIIESPQPGILVEAPDIGLSENFYNLADSSPLKVVISGVLSTLGISELPSCTLCIHSTIPIAAGLGSGAAIAVAVIRALSAYMSSPLPDEAVNDLAFQSERIFHGTPSGIDNSVITYARPIFFTRGKSIETIQVRSPFWIMIGDTGIPAPTRESVAALRELWQADPPRWDEVFSQVGEIVVEARQAIELGDQTKLGDLMNANHSLLQKMNVSCNELDALVEAACKAGALGAKLSGGGRGGNMIALVAKESAPAVAGALGNAGAIRIILTRVG